MDPKRQKRRGRGWRWAGALCALLLAVMVPAAAAPLTAQQQLAALPATHPYRELLLQFEALPQAERAVLRSWAEPDEGATSPELTAEQRTFVEKIAASLRAAAAAPPLTGADWPLLPDPDDPDNPSAIGLPAVGLPRELARLAVQVADSLPPGDAAATYAAVAQLGRQQRAGASLIEQLTGSAIEHMALAGASRRLTEFSPAELRGLAAAWQTLHPAPDLVRAFAGERDVFFIPVIENVVRPGLLALLAEEADADGRAINPAGTAAGDPATTAGAAADTATDFPGYLRLSGLIDLGPGQRRISLEDVRTGATLSLGEGRTVAGIELVEFDFEGDRAVIRQGEQRAVVHLESRRIVLQRQAADRLRTLFDGYDLIHGEGNGTKMLAEVVARVRAHPDGVDGYLAGMFAAYQQVLDAHLAAASSPTAVENLPTTDDPLLGLFMPTFATVARTFQRVDTQPVMLQAAIHHRLGQLGAAEGAAPADPWAAEEGGAFAVEATPDGGFVLRSRYEMKAGHPFTVKFAAPDAGIVRAP